MRLLVPLIGPMVKGNTMVKVNSKFVSIMVMMEINVMEVNVMQ